MLYLLLLFAFGVVGITHIVVDGVLLQWLRNLADKHCRWLYSLLTCYQCSGFWVGALLGGPLFYPAIKYFSVGSVLVLTDYPWYCSLIMVLLCGGAGSFIATLGAAVLNYLEAQSIIELPEEK